MTCLLLLLLLLVLSGASSGRVVSELLDLHAPRKRFFLTNHFSVGNTAGAVVMRIQDSLGLLCKTRMPVLPIITATTASSR